MRRGEHISICLVFKIYLENTDSLCYSVCVPFDLLRNLHDQNEYDNYFVISREANMLATLKNKKMK